MLKENTLITNFQPHFHLRGKAMQVEAILPDGSTQIISYVDKFNFNWMTNYIYDDDAAPVFPKGTIIHVSALYDNTQGEQEQPRSRAVGRLRRSDGRRNGARLDERRVSERRRIQGAGRGAQGEGRDRDRRVSSRFARSRAAPRLLAIDGFTRAFRGCSAGVCACRACRARLSRSAAQLPSEPPRQFGAGITGAFEGWFENPDGTRSFLVGYLNRNRAGAGRSDRPEQSHRARRPRHGPADAFPARAGGRACSSSRCPKEFTPQQRLTWTIVANGQTNSIPLRLHRTTTSARSPTSPIKNMPPDAAIRRRADRRSRGRSRSLAKSPSRATTSVSTPLCAARCGRRRCEVLERHDGACRASRRRPCELTWSKYRGPGNGDLREGQAGDGNACGRRA